MFNNRQNRTHAKQNIWALNLHTTHSNPRHRINLMQGNPGSTQMRNLNSPGNVRNHSACPSLKNHKISILLKIQLTSELKAKKLLTKSTVTCQFAKAKKCNKKRKE